MNDNEVKTVQMTAEEAAHPNDFATKEGTEHGC